MIAKLLLLLPFLFGACQSVVDPAAPETSLDLQTQGSEFVLSPSAGSVSVPFTVTNHGARSIPLPRCGDRLMIGLDRREGRQWVQYSGDSCITIYRMDPVELKSGQALDGIREVREPGQYRLRIGMSDTDHGVWSNVSNSFTVR